MKITVGMIVLNGEPFLRYSLRSLYNFAHQIIVVEGACPSAAAVANADGHSRDETLATLDDFKRTQDPEGKVIVVTAEDEGHKNGFWSEKDEMSQAYSKRAIGDWLWQVDVDEFYLPEDIERIVHMLESQPDITQMSFIVKTFSASPSYLVDSYYLRGGENAFRRLFAWKPSYRYAKHRPPTVIDESGRDLASLHPVSAKSMARQGIYMYHYEQLFPKQVEEKCSYYSRVHWSSELNRVDSWMKNCYSTLQHPYRVHMVYGYLSWLERYHGRVPPAVLELVEAVQRGQHPGVELRQTEDIELLLSSWRYTFGRSMLKTGATPYYLYRSIRKRLGEWKQRRRHQIRKSEKLLINHT